MPFYLKQNAGRAGRILGRPARITGLTRVLAGILFCALLHNPSPGFSASLPDTYSLPLTWEVSPSPEVAGYHLYYGTASGNYTSSIILGNVATATVSGLSYGVTYYFALTAYDTNGLESDFSNEASYLRELPGAQMQINAAAGGQFTLTVAGPAGQTYAIEATPDLATWTTIATVTVDGSGALAFTDTNAANYSQRFYRTREIP